MLRIRDSLHIQHKLRLKLWQKLFLSILSMIVVLFNGGMFWIANINYNQQILREKNRAAAEEAFIAASIYKDLMEMSDSGILGYDIIIQSFEVYQSYYLNQKICLELFHNSKSYSEQVYSLNDREELSTQENIQNLLIRRIDSKPYLFVASELNSPYQDFQIVLSYSLEEIVQLRQQMIQITIGIDLILTGTVMLLLLFIVRRMMKPLELLSEATTEIAAGDYGKQIAFHGEDELEQLAGQFNQMSVCIAEKVNQLEEENETKKRLIDNMAHELRTPLTAILGYAEYIKLAKIGEEEKIEVLDYVIGQVKRLENLSNTLLKLASVREEVPEYSLVEVKELVHTLQYIFKEKSETHKIALEFVSEINYLTGNRDMILLLLVNLIENAVRACEQEGKIIVRFLQTDKEISIEVEDNGIGMEAEELAKIAEPFYRVDKARSRKNGGVGLGVTLCQQIAEYHHATLSYESRIHEGTKASFLIST